MRTIGQSRFSQVMVGIDPVSHEGSITSRKVSHKPDHDGKYEEVVAYNDIIDYIWMTSQNAFPHADNRYLVLFGNIIIPLLSQHEGLLRT